MAVLEAAFSAEKKKSLLNFDHLFSGNPRDL